MSGEQGQETGTVLVTGAAGFIGFHACRRLLAEGRRVVGVDNLDPYYDPGLKRARLRELEGADGFRFEELDLAEADAAKSLFERHAPSRVVHLAAQPGVRYSLTEPGAYGRANLVAFVNVLEGCRHGGVRHLVYASSSSVYGANESMPFRTRDPVDHPLSLYGATKRANELMAHSYAHLFGLPTTGLRFFTVYGPWGRPDMAVFLFTRAIADGRPIDLFNGGRMSRDFTYVDDVVDAVFRLLDHTPATPAAGAAPTPAAAAAPFRIYNVGGDRPVPVERLVALIEAELGRPARTQAKPMQAGDAPATWADIDDLTREVGWRPQVPIEDGIRRFVAWYRDFYSVPAANPETLS